MTPIRPPGGPRSPSAPGPEGSPTETASAQPSIVRGSASSSEIVLDLDHLPVNLRGQTILVVFNPAARDGRIGKEFPRLQSVLERAGARVIPVETVPGEAERRRLIQEAARRVLAEGGGRVYVLPYGGDGTIWETVGEVVRAAGIPLEPVAISPEAVQRFNSQVTFFLANKGTASDNAVQVDAPTRIGAMPRYLRGGVQLPFWFPTIETVEAPGVFEVAGHSYGLGAGGLLFATRMENIRANPTAWYNRGLFSYLRLLPRVMASRYGLLGFDVELKHFDSNGGMIREATMRGAEVITTPNRIMAGVGGVPGAWGETKVVVLPPGPAGIAAIGEYIGRGLATKLLGWNRVGPRSRLRTVSEDRQWLIQPGERVDVRLRVPTEGMTGLLWDLLRSAHERNVSWRWIKPGPEVPAAGEPLPVPGQRNGDVVPASTGFTARSPGIPIAMLAHPNSLAVRLARSSAFINGAQPLISDQQVTSFLSDHEPSMWSAGPEALRARSPFVSRPRLNALLDRYGVPRQYGLDLLLAAQTMDHPLHLERFAQRRVTVEAAHEFLESNRGDRWLEGHRGSFRPVGERALRGGVPLAVGLGAMMGGELLADRLGLDRVQDRELRFGLVTYLAHGAQANFQPVWEVAANRLLGRPYDFLQLRTERAAGEVFAQWTLESQPSLTRAISSAWASQNLGLEMGIARSIPSRLAGWGTIPLRAAWNMGEGLIFSRITEQLVQDLPNDSPLKRYGPTAAFFVPDLLRIAGERHLLSFMEARPFRLAGRAFAVGFISDMAFTGIHRAANGERAGYELSLDYRTAELRRERGEIPWYSWRQIPRLLAPSLSAYIDSHEYLLGTERSERAEVRMEDHRESAALRDSIQQGLAWLPSVLGEDAISIFSAEIRLTPVEREMAEQLETCRGGRLLRDAAGFAETARYLRRQFRGTLRSDAEARHHLARIFAAQLQQTISYLASMPLTENADLRFLFNDQGRLRPNRELALSRWLSGEGTGPLFASA